MRVLELYSGIGGMHMALKESKVAGEIVASIDINPVANTIYQHNFPDVTLYHRNIQSLTPQFINKLAVDTILMSPPCQPFTRNGLQEDVNDERCRSFKHILEILPSLEVTRILIENVKGFEDSEMRKLLITALTESDFKFQECILSPTQLGVPNSRHRYYLLAKRPPEVFNFETGPLLDHFPLAINNNNKSCFKIGDVIEEELDINDYLINEKLLKKYAEILDICFKDSARSCCFTKAYGRYIEGTGSVYTEFCQDCVQDTFKQTAKFKEETEERLELLKRLKLRFFTPKEICRLMSFPETFSFPEEVSKKQRYMVLGNSVNVKVVAELIKLLA